MFSPFCRISDSKIDRITGTLTPVVSMQPSARLAAPGWLAGAARQQMDTLAHRVGIAAVALAGAYACSRPCHASTTSTAQCVQPPAWDSKSKSSTDDTGGCREPAADVTSSPKDGPITTGLLPGATERVGFKWWTPHDGARARALWGDARVTALIGGPFDDEAVSERLRAEVHRASTEGVQ